MERVNRILRRLRRRLVAIVNPEELVREQRIREQLTRVQFTKELEKLSERHTREIARLNQKIQAYEGKLELLKRQIDERGEKIKVLYDRNKEYAARIRGDGPGTPANASISEDGTPDRP